MSTKFDYPNIWDTAVRADNIQKDWADALLADIPDGDKWTVATKIADAIAVVDALGYDMPNVDTCAVYRRVAIFMTVDDGIAWADMSMRAHIDGMKAGFSADALRADRDCVAKARKAKVDADAARRAAIDADNARLAADAAAKRVADAAKAKADADARMAARPPMTPVDTSRPFPVAPTRMGQSRPVVNTVGDWADAVDKARPTRTTAVNGARPPVITSADIDTASWNDRVMRIVGPVVNRACDGNAHDDDGLAALADDLMTLVARIAKLRSGASV